MGNLWNKLKQQQKQRGAILGMNMVIVILCVVLFFGGVKMVQELVYVFSRPGAVSFMEMDIAAENYVPLVDLYHDDVVYGGFVGDRKQEYYGVAKYFEAASMYRAFSETGDVERAAREADKMNAAYEEMGSWNIAADSIREQLGLDKD